MELASVKPRLFLLAGVALLLAGGCATSSAVPSPFPGAIPPVSATTPGSARPGTGGIVQNALRFLGTPYRDGGSDPSGFDCSGFTQYVFGLSHVRLPREVRAQFQTGRKLGLRKIAPGDLIFFSTTAPGASHVGVVLDDHQFVHAPSTSGTVRVESYSAPYWNRRIVGVRRVN